ncbi:MAG: DUF4945 domain-containing protein [Prevotella sp.]|jgi:hypothetical protein|nr:DUF4945 domain-containing protein [Prevotella sp.]
MKKIIYILLTICLPFLANSCYDRDVIDGKDGVILPTVEGLKSTLSGSDQAVLSWSIPSSGISDEIKRPISVFIQVYKGTTRESYVYLEDEPTTWNLTLKEPDSKYKVVVKLYGNLKEKSYGKSDEIYSFGQTVEVN